MIILENNKIRTLVSDIYTTRAYTAINKTIAAQTRFKESKGMGMINQILLKSNSQAYTFKALIDNEIAYDFTYAFFLANTADISNISAYVAGGFNYLTIQDLFFQKSFQLSIHLSTSIIFSLLHVRYAIVDEVIIKELV